MEPVEQDGHVSAPARVVAFVRGFLPEQTLQLLFPLASVLLFLGASNFWFKLELPNIPESYLSQGAHLRTLLDWFTHGIALWVSVEQQLANMVVQFGFIASLALWTLNVRNPLKKFAYWVVVPVVSALFGYAAYFILSADHRHAFIGALVAAVGFPAPKYSRLPIPANGLYLTVAGLILMVLACGLFRNGSIDLPLRFRRDVGAKRITEREASRDGRDVFVLLGGALLWADLASFLWLIPFGTMESRSVFPVYEWLPSLASAVVSAFIAVFLFRERVGERVREFFRLQPLHEYGLAIVLPLVAILVPRVIFKMFGDLPLSPRGSGEWSEILPSPFPEILTVYAIAVFEEFVLRGYLQTTLEKYFSVKRAILLTALLWGLLPLGFGVAQRLPLGTFAIGRSIFVTVFAGFAASVVYSVPLGWLYARTRSIIPVALMHGTIALFHVGWGYQIHINHPQLYWVELVLWIVVGWYMFRRYPVSTAAVQSVEPA